MLKDRDEFNDKMLCFTLEIVADSLETGMNWQSEKNRSAALIIRNMVKILLARSQEPGARSQEPGARSQEPEVLPSGKGQESLAKNRSTKVEHD